MNSEKVETFDFGEPSSFESRNCVDWIFDGPGDTTVRPCSPEMWKYFQAEREKIARWQAFLNQEKSGPETYDP